MERVTEEQLSNILGVKYKDEVGNTRSLTGAQCRLIRDACVRAGMVETEPLPPIDEAEKRIKQHIKRGHLQHIGDILLLMCEAIKEQGWLDTDKERGD